MPFGPHLSLQLSLSQLGSETRVVRDKFAADLPRWAVGGAALDRSPCFPFSRAGNAKTPAASHVKDEGLFRFFCLERKSEIGQGIVGMVNIVIWNKK